jgi:hypothetical protein
MAVKIGIADIRVGWTPEQMEANSGPTIVRFSHPQPNFYTISPSEAPGPFFDTVIKKLGSDKIEMLSIYAHGIAMEDKTGIHGGFGIELGSEDITLANADSLFRRFNGKFQSALLGIELVGCAVAEKSKVGPANQVSVGDGIALCEAIAAAAGTCVRASSSAQRFDEISQFTTSVPDRTTVVGRVSRDGVVMDPGPWEGNVWIISSKNRKLISRDGGTFP